MSRFTKALQEFVASKTDFAVVYSTVASTNQQSALITSKTQRVCVLDSSFNPPHLGHYALVEESLKSNYDQIPIGNKSLLLLLSIQNADKNTAHLSLEALEHRIDMIYLMANDVAKRFPINVSIGLIKHAKFVDKSLSIANHIEARYPNILRSGFKLTFLIGFDTLIRILNPKYYLPDKLSNSLEHFMKITDLFCLTRQDGTTSITQQQGYIKEISSGEHEDIPSHWSNNIFLLKNLNEDIANISSSSIRREISRGARRGATGKEEWNKHVIPEIAQYIEEKNLYKS
ncbi:hypothetical protein KGF56_001243 [Candida oxycetoniae]|uniref:Cytidyltransferase-like domain-containing protein n=1 Tax=Candida oxycetoniae TaxID=497107 RepID=A0AAI9WZG2_9ASCO|nr:uncharacterized protein KGF56_001243 [Candida oxycetoniae]KAI3406024.2 hypothetical protein KGF56_001243 [Candida oxycetoniae]